MSINRHPASVSGIHYHDIVGIRMLHLDGYGIVDHVDEDKNKITFSKLLTAKTQTYEWSNDVAKNIVLDYDREQMTVLTPIEFLSMIGRNNCPIIENDFLTIGDFICPNTDSYDYYRIDATGRNYFVYVRITGLNFGRFDREFGDARPIKRYVKYDTAIKVDAASGAFLGFAEMERMGYPSELCIKGASRQIRGNKFDLGEFEKIQDFLLFGEVL